MQTFLAAAGEEGLTWEAKAEDERGALRPDTIRKAACGLANQLGGYMILGATRRTGDSAWALPGIAMRDEPELWLGQVVRGLRPVPRLEVKSWPVGQDRFAAVAWVEPVPMPPCMTAQGQVYERVSGATLPVTDPSVLARMLQRGEEAQARAEASAQHVATRALHHVQWQERRSVTVAAALAPIARETLNIGPRLFNEAFDAEVSAALARFMGRRPEELETAVRQDSLRYTGHRGIEPVLHVGGTATRSPRASWTIQATWDGTVAFSVTLDDLAVARDPGLPSLLERGWSELSQLVARLGGYGPARFHLAVETTQPSDHAVAPDSPMPPSATTLYDGLPDRVHVRRHAEVRAPSPSEVASVDREVSRASGTWVAEP